ncbi:MAG TPA: hypothetical protein VGG08_02425 [Solirubrobacteraceae bacterium]
MRIGHRTISMGELSHWTAVEASINEGNKPPTPAHEGKTVRLGMLMLLLSYEWVQLEARAEKVSVTSAEVEKLLLAEFRSKAKMEATLASRGESLSDARYIAESKALIGALRHKIGVGPEAEIVPALYAHWRRFTECRPGYVVEECSESHVPAPRPIVTGSGG